MTIKTIKWNDAMTTGISEIDDQHKELINQLNLLTAAMIEGKGREEIGKILDFLSEYAVEHFRYEEEMMEKYSCPVSVVNKIAHQKFIQRVQKFSEELKRYGSTTKLVLDVKRDITDWTVNHIVDIDTRLYSYVKKAK